MGWASESFRLVLIDCPPVLNLADFELIAAPAESVVVVIRARKTIRESLSKVLAQIDPRKLAGVVFNGAEDLSSHDRYRYKRERKFAK
jgi:Mrp family chromosome partitioning ATPase